VDVKNPVRWSATLASGLLIALSALTPVASATSPASPAVATRDFVEGPDVRLLESAVPPSECMTPLIQQYFSSLVAGLTPTQLSFVAAHQVTMLNVPTYETLFFGTAGDPDFALEAHAAQLRNTFRDLKQFWSGTEDVQFGDIQLMAMHGDTLADADRTERALTAMVEFGVIPAMTPAQITAEADAVAAFLAANPALVDNPLWTLNAYAFSGEGDPDPEIAAIPDKLVFGDGVLDFLAALGLADVGPRVVMGHEFGHHLQIELGVFDTGPADPAEATRRTELMADALAAYHGVHKRGLALNQKRVVDTLLSFFAVGDCSFASPGHHGTPLQRERAADWGADLAKAAQPKSRILPGDDVVELFDAALPGIISG
jgi:hypothetical protein